MLDRDNGLVGVGDGESSQTATKNAALALCLVCWPHFARHAPPPQAVKLLRLADPFAHLEPFEATDATLDLVLNGGGGAGQSAAAATDNGFDDPLKLRNGEVITIERAREFTDWYCKFYKCVKSIPTSRCSESSDFGADAP